MDNFRLSFTNKENAEQYAGPQCRAGNESELKSLGNDHSRYP